MIRAAEAARREPALREAAAEAARRSREATTIRRRVTVLTLALGGGLLSVYYVMLTGFNLNLKINLP